MLKCSTVWNHVRKLALTVNMRVLLSGDTSVEEFAKILLDIGDGKMIERDCEIEITKNIGNACRILEELMSIVYGDISNINSQSNEWFCERAILTPTNEKTTTINDSILRHLPGEEKVYESINESF